MKVWPALVGFLGLSWFLTGPVKALDASPEYKTLFLTHAARMETHLPDLEPKELDDLQATLEDVAAHPRVQGLILDLGNFPDIQKLYTLWDTQGPNGDSAALANQVLFGCHAPLSTTCPTGNHGAPVETDGIHDLIQAQLAMFPSIEYLVLVGGDPILPMARLRDRTVLLPETRYTQAHTNGILDITPDGTTVGQALAANTYLSDDPLASLQPIHPSDLEDGRFLPDLAVGRLVERPVEIQTVLLAFLVRDGLLDLSQLDPVDGHKMQCTGYDFLTDSAQGIADRFRAALGASEGNSLSPLDDALIGQEWNDFDLVAHLCGNGGAPYGIINLNGHGTHYLEGVPGDDRFDIQGLPSSELVRDDLCGEGLGLDLAGRVMYGFGSHGGLPVNGDDPNDPDHSLDLPQAYLGRGVTVYIANSGFGWGLKHNIGYGERLVDTFSRLLVSSQDTPVGKTVVESKHSYASATISRDPYHDKTSMQWTVFGLPMYAIRIDAADPEIESRQEVLLAGANEDKIFPDDISVLKKTAFGDPPVLPPFMTVIEFDIASEGLFRKFDADNHEIPLDDPCPTTDLGCFYAFGDTHPLPDRTDLPVEPYFQYDLRVAGTRHHGTLWLGGEYEEEPNWFPFVPTLISDRADGSDHGPMPRTVLIQPTVQRVSLGNQPCEASDKEVVTLFFSLGSVQCTSADCPGTFVRRSFTNIRSESFYFNNTDTGDGNCDNEGPSIAPGFSDQTFDQLRGGTLHWAVEASDAASEVWRVVVVYDLGDGTWRPIELENDQGIWRSSLSLAQGGTLDYVIQAVDTRGNASWLTWQSDDLPASGVPLGVADVREAVIPSSHLHLDGFETGDTSRWSLALP